MSVESVDVGVKLGLDSERIPLLACTPTPRTALPGFLQEELTLGISYSQFLAIYLMDGVLDP